jgi:hypothetical protein
MARRKERRGLGFVALLAVVTACGAGPGRTPSGAPAISTGAVPTPEKTAPAMPAPRDDARPAPASAEDRREPVVVSADPRVLRALEAEGLDFGTEVAGARGASLTELSRAAPYRALVDAVAADVAESRVGDPASGVGMKHAHRTFDVRWLRSDRARFDLVAIVNRLDRRPFAPAHCGEVRLVYRLAYRVSTPTGPVESRLPMTVNVVYFAPRDADGSCRALARAWLAPAFARPDEEARWLLSEEGPLSAARRAAWTPKSVELNFQSVRWPSTVRPSMAGHAEYVLRAFRRLPREPYFEPLPLENTLDVPRLERDAALREELVRLLGDKESLDALDAGVLVVPERFLARRAVSVSPHGLARRANRPFRSVLPPGVFASADLSGYRTIRTPLALLRRLDALSCPGCHQSRSLAGFHLLGVEAEGDVVDAVAVPMSPHFHADLARRRAYVSAVARDRTPDESRPPAERGAGDDGPGAHCGLGEPGFSEWSCGAGLLCEPMADPEVGECVSASGLAVGDPCEHGSISQEDDPRKDVATLATASCGDGRVCEANAVGFPGGMCEGGCGALPAGAVCGGVPLLTEFNGCLARGASFDRCIAESTRPGALRACGFHAPCRDDYVCARGAAGDACMPPYFLFQLRVDGHPL